MISSTMNGISVKQPNLTSYLTLKYPTAVFDEALYEEDRMLDIHTYDYANQMAGYDLLVINDFGLMELDIDK